ncbi:MAG: hypothetical protein IJU92_03490 [Spirochaetaceae bacterium]|nr:hypothetical protein [Spirochaetaceae bacterium]
MEIFSVLGSVMFPVQMLVGYLSVVKITYKLMRSCIRFFASAVTPYTMSKKLSILCHFIIE